MDQTAQNSLRQRSTPRMADARSLMQPYEGRVPRATCMVTVVIVVGGGGVCYRYCCCCLALSWLSVSTLVV